MEKIEGLLEQQGPTLAYLLTCHHSLKKYHMYIFCTINTLIDVKLMNEFRATYVVEFEQ